MNLKKGDGQGGSLNAYAARTWGSPCRESLSLGKACCWSGIGKPLSASRWALDPDALLRHSADSGERERIRVFLESVADEGLPAQVRDLLDSVEERATALADVGPARLVRGRDAPSRPCWSSIPSPRPIVPALASA